ncbi:hypothetical protein BDD12DRAFT_889429 [Trichophaea hybrida]|nr:hypothetical protein BDD12DRAFT_889429 [Trichophaea hybrida]
MGGTLNFTHFAAITTSLATATMLDLLFSLIHEQTALQLRGGQTSWDLLVPIYMGDRAKRFDRTALTAILIQVKNQEKSVVLEDTKYDLSWNQKAYPLIIFQMELGKPESKSNRGRRQVGFIPVQSQFENVVYFSDPDGPGGRRKLRAPGKPWAKKPTVGLLTGVRPKEFL